VGTAASVAVAADSVAERNAVHQLRALRKTQKQE
jgi:hypothetical protein